MRAGKRAGGTPLRGDGGGRGKTADPDIQPRHPAQTSSPDIQPRHPAPTNGNALATFFVRGMRAGRNATPPSPRVALRGSRAGEGGRAEPCAVGCRGAALATFVPTSEGGKPP